MDTSCTSSTCKQCRFAQEGIELLLPYVGQRISVLKEGPPKSCPALHYEIFFLIERSRFVFQAVLLTERELPKEAKKSQMVIRQVTRRETGF